jgi:hypothetical protein
MKAKAAWTGKVFVVLTVLIVALAGTESYAEQARVLLACSPTWEAINACQSAGGRYDTERCRCSRGNFKSIVSPPCALVCFDGFLDARACRCVHPK